MRPSPTVTLPVVVAIGEGARVEVGVEVGVVVVGGGNGDDQSPRLVVDEDGLARTVAEALLTIAATMLDARADTLADVVGDALDAFDSINT